MKPQALQDAIKSAALKKKERGWKEPVVKQYKISCEEFKEMKEKTGTIGNGPGSPVTAPKSSFSQPSISEALFKEVINKQELSMRGEISKVLGEMQSTREEINCLKHQLETFQKSIEEQRDARDNDKHISSVDPNNTLVSLLNGMALEIKELRSDVAGLRNENNELKKLMVERRFNESGVCSVESDDISRDLSEVSKEMRLVRKETEEIRRQLQEKTFSGGKVQGREANGVVSSSGSTLPSNTETAKTKVENKLLPFGSKKIYEHQRRDELLREFIQSQRGPYSVDDSKIKQVDGRNLVFFHKRIYVPKRLRKEAIEYYCATYGDQALEQMEKNCIWPELETDFKQYKI